jgi:hypothetical protein
LEDLGKVAEIAESQSPLKIGLKGTFKGNRFELTGTRAARHELGGVWDEWYATFSNGWVGWLAEAQGKFYLTFYQPLPKRRAVPPFESCSSVKRFRNSEPNAFDGDGKRHGDGGCRRRRNSLQINAERAQRLRRFVGQRRRFRTIDYR